MFKQVSHRLGDDGFEWKESSLELLVVNGWDSEWTREVQTEMGTHNVPRTNRLTVLGTGVWEEETRGTPWMRDGQRRKHVVGKEAGADQSGGLSGETGEGFLPLYWLNLSIWVRNLDSYPNNRKGNQSLELEETQTGYGPTETGYRLR